MALGRNGYKKMVHTNTLATASMCTVLTGRSTLVSAPVLVAGNSNTSSNAVQEQVIVRSRERQERHRAPLVIADLS